MEEIKERISSGMITAIKSSEVFVFGSNLSGLHLGGAAKTALGWGAEMGRPTGPQGSTYAIPTVDVDISRTLAIEEIRPHADAFIKYALYNPSTTFLVTEIGCGIAGHKPEDIAPLFCEAEKLINVHLPKSFWDVIKQLF